MWWSHRSSGWKNQDLGAWGPSPWKHVCGWCSETCRRHVPQPSPRTECLLQLIMAQLMALLQLAQLWTVLGGLTPAVDRAATVADAASVTEADDHAQRILAAHGCDMVSTNISTFFEWMKERKSRTMPVFERSTHHRNMGMGQNTVTPKLGSKFHWQLLAPKLDASEHFNIDQICGSIDNHQDSSSFDPSG